MPQGLLKRQTDLRIDGTLGDAVNNIFNGFLSRDNTRLGIIDLIDTALDRCGLARTGGAGNDDDAAGKIQRILPKTR